MSRDEHDLINHLSHVWELYALSQDPKHLAGYLELGGEIDDDVRRAVCRVLRDGPPSKKGGRNSLFDVEVYLAIDKIRLEPTIEFIGTELFSKGQAQETRKPVPNKSRAPKKMTKIEARKIYIERLGKAVEDDTIRKQYDRGKRILKSNKLEY
jgi:hypothetical protein